MAIRPPGDPTKMNDLCGEKEKPRYGWNFLLAENAALYLVLRRRGNPRLLFGYPVFLWRTLVIKTGIVYTVITSNTL